MVLVVVMCMWVYPLTFHDGFGRCLRATVEWQSAAFILYGTALVIHTVALETAKQVKEALIPEHVWTDPLREKDK